MRERSSLRGGEAGGHRHGRALALLALALLGGCGGAGRHGVIGGDPRAGALAIAQQACGSCHEIPGIEEADGRVGPSLAHFASQQAIAGPLANVPVNLLRYLKTPQSVIPGNYMPDAGLTDRQARDIAAYLYTLK